jgi:hypothetical protein
MSLSILKLYLSEIEEFLYLGDMHLFGDPDLPDYVAGSAELMLERVRRFLGEIG